MKFNLKNADGTFNGKLIASIISLGIVLVQQVLTVFGYSFSGNWASIVAVINTVLTILGMLGVVTDVTPVTETNVPATSTTPTDTTEDTQAVTSSNANVQNTQCVLLFSC